MLPTRNSITVILIALVSLFFPLAAGAQFPEYAAGIRGGAQFSMAWFSPSASQAMPVSAVVGAQFRMVSEKYFGIVVELNYAQRGFATYNDDRSLSHRRLDYVELPFLSHITFGRKLFRYFINLGPSISCLVADNRASTPSSAPQHTLAVKNRFDYAIVGGMGFEFNTKYGIYTIDARYNFGLGNIFGSRASDAFKTSSNQNISVAFAYLFPF